MDCQTHNGLLFCVGDAVDAAVKLGCEGDVLSNETPDPSVVAFSEPGTPFASSKEIEKVIGPSSVSVPCIV